MIAITLTTNAIAMGQCSGPNETGVNPTPITGSWMSTSPIQIVTAPAETRVACINVRYVISYYPIAGGLIRTYLKSGETGERYQLKANHPSDQSVVDVTVNDITSFDGELPNQTWWLYAYNYSSAFPSVTINGWLIEVYYRDLLPIIEVYPTSHDFVPIPAGRTSEPLEITITNTGELDLHISDVTLSDTANFTLDVNGGSNPIGSTSSTIIPEGNGTVTVIFSPASEGRFATELTINSDDPHNPNFKVSLTGRTPQQTIFVDKRATGANDGSSWTNAYKYLQDALDFAHASEEIWVAKGTYRPDRGVGITLGDREATFQFINGVNLKGGYSGFGEPDPNARDFELYKTILSGDLKGDDEPNFVNYEDNSYHVVKASGIDANTIIDGFTITGGNANSTFYIAKGGGMYNNDSNPTVTNCNFTGNTADYGGGISNTNASSPTLTNCTFTNNRADDWGGGMYNDSSNPTVTNCTFSGNNAINDGGGMLNDGTNPMVIDCNFSDNTAGRDGGGIYNRDGSNPTVTNCTFSGNEASDSGSGMYNEDNSSPTVTDCNFTGNSANYGGGMYNYYNSSPTLINCKFSGNEARIGGGGMINNSSSCPTVTNCTFFGNTALDSIYGNGGGMWNSDGSNPALTNCTFSDNEARIAGGSMNNSSSSPTVTNCIFSNNTASINGGGMHNGDSSPMVNKCNFTGNTSDYGGGMDNIDSSPTVTNCIFNSNSAYSGGGISNGFESNSIVTNCKFTGNTANYNGGGMDNYYYSSPTVTNCTFSGNLADEEGGGMDNNRNCSPTVINCILSGNVPDEIVDDDTSETTVTHSDVQGGWPGTGNIDADPCFVDANNPDPNLWNLRLKPDSPCIDAGDNNSVPTDMADIDGDGNTVEPTPFDLNGFPRFVDDLCTVDTGNPGTMGPPVVDMGAYEFLPADIDSSGAVNLGDLANLALHWAVTDCGRCDGANLTCDGIVDWNDVRELLDYWLAGTEPEL